jgi:hypothetical protein
LTCKGSQTNCSQTAVNAVELPSTPIAVELPSTPIAGPPSYQNVIINNEFAKERSEVQVSAVPAGAASRRPAKVFGIRLPYFMLLVAFVILAIVAIAVGAALGTKAHKNSTSSGNSPANGPPTPAVPVNQTVIQSLSSLAVAGYVYKGVSYIWLFYQGNDANIRMSTWTSTTSTWGPPAILGKAHPGTPLAAASFNQTSTFDIVSFTLHINTIYRSYKANTNIGRLPSRALLSRRQQRSP